MEVFLPDNSYFALMNLNIPKKTGRIGFIDLLRAYAILMMVEGHLTDALLMPELRDDSNVIYFVWNFMRGITAPVFFFASGLVFTFLLQKEEAKGVGLKNPRVRKGIKRGLMLLGLGYLMQINSDVWTFLQTWDTQYLDVMLRTHVFHIIAMALFIIIGSYLLLRLLRINHWLSYFLIGNFIFLIYPDLLQYDWDGILPMALEKYMPENGRFTFTIIPWTGFSLIGASLGKIYQKHPKLVDSYSSFIVIFVLGLVLQFLSPFLLSTAHELTGIYNFRWHCDNNAQYFRLAQVFLITGLFGFIAKSITVPKIITRIGSETIPIFVLHSIVIYGTFTGFGLVDIFGRTLNGWQCAGLALILEAMSIALAYYGNDYRAYFSKLTTKVKTKLFGAK